MNTTEKLQAIRAKCQQCMDEGRGNGIDKWTAPAEAGWRATIAAIDDCIAEDPAYQAMYNCANEKLIAAIIAAWEGQI